MKLASVFVPLCLLVLSACPEKIEEQPDPEEQGPTLIPCAAPEECPEAQPTCRFGLCARECQADAACDAVPGTYCSAQQICEPGCRSSAECTGGTVCQSGTCVEGASCGDKCDCPVGQVCIGTSCASPPEACSGPADCPRGPLTPEDVCDAYRCDGFTNTCLETTPTPCANADDCFGRLGCEAGCLCTPNQQCVPDADCTIATERDDCGVGFYCDASLVCAAIPVCSADNDCAAAGLTCDEPRNICVRPQQCTVSADCTATPPTTFCDTRTQPSFCAVPNCLNQGVTCNASQACSADGRCVTQGTGDPCTTDGTCPDDQYCALVNGTGACATGCRGNGDPECGVNESCNAAHECEDTGGLQPVGGPCPDGDGDCQAGLVCYDGSCAESCEGYNVDECAGQGCCSLTAKPCCNLAHVCSDGFFGTCLSP